MPYQYSPEPAIVYSREDLDTPLDPRNVTSRNKILRDVSLNERGFYVKGINGYVRKSIYEKRYYRPIRYVTKTEAFYLTNKSPPSVTAPIMEPIARSIPRNSEEDYLFALEQVIIIAVPDEERAAYPSYDPLW